MSIKIIRVNDNDDANLLIVRKLLVLTKNTIGKKIILNQFTSR